MQSRFPRADTDNVYRLEDMIPTVEIPMQDGSDAHEGEEDAPRYSSIEEFREWQIAKMISAIMWTLTIALVILMLGGTYQLLEWFFSV